MPIDPNNFPLTKLMPMLLTIAAVVVAVIATVVYAVTEDVFIAAAVAVVLFLSDYLGFKMVLKHMQKQKNNSSDKDA